MLSMHAVCVIFVVIVLAVPSLAAEPVEWKVVSVHDGDTLRAIDAANVQHTIRLQAANDIAATCPHYRPKSFKRLG